MLRISMISRLLLVFSLICHCMSNRSIQLQEVTSEYDALWNPSFLMTLSANNVLDCVMVCPNERPNCAAVSFDMCNDHLVSAKYPVNQSNQSSSPHIYQTEQPNGTDYPGFSIKTNGLVRFSLVFPSHGELY